VVTEDRLGVTVWDNHGDRRGRVSVRLDGSVPTAWARTDAAFVTAAFRALREARSALLGGGR
jgi:hypothetical protein